MAQQYAPDVVDGRAYYDPSTHGMESRFSERARIIRAILHPEMMPTEPEDGQQGGSAPDAGKSTDEGKTE